MRDTQNGIPGRDLTDHFKTAEEGRRYRALVADDVSAIDRRMAELEKNSARTQLERNQYVVLNNRRNSRLAQLEQIDRQLRLVTPFAKWNHEEWVRTNEAVLTTLAGLGAAASLRGRPAVQSKASVSSQRGSTANSAPAVTPSQLRSSSGATKSGDLKKPSGTESTKAGTKQSSGPDSSSKGANSEIISTAQSGRLADLLPETSLSTRQAAIHAQLSEPGSFATIPKGKVSMADLRAIGEVTGDEYNMFTKEGNRLVIRGDGSNIRVSPEMYDDLLNGQYGKFSGHTHPPGYSIEPGPADRPFLRMMQQERSAIWGDGGVRIFGPVGPADDARILSEINRSNMAKIYGN